MPTLIKQDGLLCFHMLLESFFAVHVYNHVATHPGVGRTNVTQVGHLYKQK